MPRLTPTLHADVPLQTRVRVDAQYLGKEVSGTVAGIASLHVVFQYIIILDEPHHHEGETYTAITALGSHLMNESGEYAWRLTSQEAHNRAIAESAARVTSGLDKPLSRVETLILSQARTAGQKV